MKNLEQTLDKMIEEFPIKGVPLLFVMNKTTGANIGDTYKGCVINKVNDWVIEGNMIYLCENIRFV
jgi:hypothetical protein